jgi:hypothetical protein
MGWSNLQNGDLIKVAESNGFELLITTDKNLKYQQNIKERRIAILVLPTTCWPKIQVYMRDVLAEIQMISRFEYKEIAFSN